MRDPLQPKIIWPHLVLTAVAFMLAARDWQLAKPRSNPADDSWRTASAVPAWSGSALWLRANQQGPQRYLAFQARRQSYLASVGATDLVLDPFQLATVEFEPRSTAPAERLRIAPWHPEPSTAIPLSRSDYRSVASSDTPRPAYRNLAPAVPPATTSNDAGALAAANTPQPTGLFANQQALAPSSSQAIEIAPISLEDDEEASGPSIDPAAPSNLSDSQLSTKSAGNGGTPACESLLVYLDELALECDTSVWALRVQKCLCSMNAMCSIDVGANDVIANDRGSQAQNREHALSELRLLAGMAETLLDRIPNIRTRSTLRRTQQALLRRLHIWEAVHEIEISNASKKASGLVSPALVRSAQAVDEFLGDSVEGERWRAFLLLDELSEPNRICDQSIVKKALDRLDSPELTPQQRAFTRQGVFSSLERELSAATPVSAMCRELLEAVEAFETDHASKHSHKISTLVRRLSYQSSANAAARAPLSDYVEKHYRNANLRFALSESFLNRVLPDEGPVEGLVKDTVVGVPVRGRSTTYSDLEIDLTPSHESISLDFLVHGRVHSRTTSSSGPAHLASRTRSQFHGRKRLWLSSLGIQSTAAIADATASNDLVKLSTDFDRVPLVGALVRTIARSQHEELKPQVRAETASKIERRAEAEFNTRVNEQLAAAEQRFQEKVLARLKNLSLGLEAIQMESTEDRAIARLRIAGEDQLAAHTPRPQALADSLASLQVHESAANNLLDRLDLAGRDFSLQELQSHLAEKLSAPLAMSRERELPEDLYIYFATEDPIRVRFDQGEIKLCLRLDGLARGDQEYGGIDVGVTYKVDFRGPVPMLTRGESVSLSGRPISFRDRMAIQGVFAKVFPKDKRIPLAVHQLSKDPRFATLTLSQIVLQDGWLGLSLSDAQSSIASANQAPLRTAQPASHVAAW